MAKFLSGRQSNFNIGIKSYTENQTVLQTIGKVGIGTTNAGNYSLYVVGAANITTSVTSPIYYGTSANLTGIVTFGSLWVNGTSRLIGNLQIDGDTNITGNLTIGGTSAYIAASTLTVGDKDIVLGFTTNPTDTTSNHGGIAIASTEGSPLISLYSAGINTLPDTYKQFMWIKGGTFGAGTTDAWLSNYAIGIGSTQVPNGVRLAVGGVQITDNTVNATNANLSYISGINLNYSGIGTVVNLYSTNSTLSSLTGTAATYTTGNFITVTGSDLYYNSGIVTTLSGTTATYTTGNITTLNSTNGYINTGIVTTLSGTTATYTTGNITTLNSTNGYINTGIVTTLTGTNLNYSGISTLGTIQISSGIVTATSGVVTYYGDGSHLFGVNAFTGTASTASFATTSFGLSGSPNITVGTIAATSLNVSGISTFAGITTHTASLFGTQASFSGVVTATSFVGDGTNITGVSGFATALSSTQGSLLNNVFKTTQSFTVGAGTSVNIQSDAGSGNIAFTRLNSIIVSSGSTLRVATGTTFIMNVLNIF